MNKTGLRDDASLAAIRLEWWPRSNWNAWPPSSESAYQFEICQFSDEVHEWIVASYVGLRWIEPARHDMMPGRKLQVVGSGHGFRS